MSKSALVAPAADAEVAMRFIGFELSKSTWLIGLYAPELWREKAGYVRAPHA